MNKVDFYDFLPFYFVGVLFVSVIAMLVIMFNTLDEDEWTKTPNGCYIHEHVERDWGSKNATLEELCPVNK